MCSFLTSFAKRPTLILTIITGMSALALISAYTAEYGFGLKPCILCLYQRVPFYAAIVLGGLGVAFSRTGQNGIAHAILWILGGNFLINSAVAFYHSGVERHWWQSIFEACSAPKMAGLSPEALRDLIMRAPAVRCDIIPWADPFLGLSMANLNVFFCLGLALVCFVSAWTAMQRPKDQTQP